MLGEQAHRGDEVRARVGVMTAEPDPPADEVADRNRPVALRQSKDHERAARAQ